MEAGLIVPLGRKQNPCHLILNPHIFISNHPDKIRQIKNETHFYFHEVVKYHAMDVTGELRKLLRYKMNRKDDNDD